MNWSITDVQAVVPTMHIKSYISHLSKERITSIASNKINECLHIFRKHDSQHHCPLFSHKRCIQIILTPSSISVLTTFEIFLLIGYYQRGFRGTREAQVYVSTTENTTHTHTYTHTHTLRKRHTLTGAFCLVLIPKLNPQQVETELKPPLQLCELMCLCDMMCISVSTSQPSSVWCPLWAVSPVAATQKRLKGLKHSER